MDLNFAKIQKQPDSISIRSDGFWEDIYWTTDYISIDGISGDVKLHRYYKSDWDGYLVQTFNSLVHTALLDCRHKTDRVDEVFQLLRQK